MPRNSHKRHAKLVHDLAETKTHFKLYKSGRVWVIAGISTMIFSLSVMAGPTIVQADSTNSTTNSDNTTTNGNDNGLQNGTVSLSGASDSSNTKVTSDNSDPSAESDTTSQSNNSNETPTTDVSNENDTDTTSTSTTTESNGSSAVSDSENKTSDSSSSSTESQIESSQSTTTTPTSTESTTSQEGIPDNSLLLKRTKVAAANIAPDDTTNTLQVSDINPDAVDLSSYANNPEAFYEQSTGYWKSFQPADADPLYYGGLGLLTSTDGNPVLARIENFDTGRVVTPNIIDYKGGTVPFPATEQGATATDVQFGQLIAAAGTPTLNGVKITATNTRTINGVVELTSKSIVTVTIPSQVLQYPNVAGLTADYFDSTVTISAGTSTTQYYNPSLAGSDGQTVPDMAETLDMSTLSAGDPARGVMVNLHVWYTADDSPLTYDTFVDVANLGVSTVQLAPEITTWSPSSTVMSGTGTIPNDTITIRNTDGSKSVTTAVQADGTWSIDLASLGMDTSQALFAVESNDLNEDIPGIASATQYKTNQRQITYINGLTGKAMTDASGAPITSATNAGTMTDSDLSLALTQDTTGTVLSNPSQYVYDSASTITAGTPTSTNTYNAISNDKLPTLTDANGTTYVTHSSVAATTLTADDLTSGITTQSVYYYPETLTADSTVTTDDFTTDKVTSKASGTATSSTDGAPTYPSGITDSDLTRTVTETITSTANASSIMSATSTTLATHTLKYARTANLTLSADGTTYSLDATTPYNDWVLQTVDGTAADASTTGFAAIDLGTSTVGGHFDTTQTDPHVTTATNAAGNVTATVNPIDITQSALNDAPNVSTAGEANISYNINVSASYATLQPKVTKIVKNTNGTYTMTGTATFPGDGILVINNGTDKVFNTTIVNADGTWSVDVSKVVEVATANPILAYEFNGVHDVAGVDVTFYQPATETIHYINGVTNTQVHDDTVITNQVTFTYAPVTMTPTLANDLNNVWDLKGGISSLPTTSRAAKDLSTITPKVTGLADENGNTSFPEVTDLPTIAGYTTSATKISAQSYDDAATTGYQIKNAEATVYYYPTSVTVDPNVPDDTSTTNTVTPKDPDTSASVSTPADPTAPTYPKGISQTDLERNVTEVVHYVNPTGTTVAHDDTITLHYTRTANVTLSADGTAYALNADTPYSTWTLDTTTTDDDGDLTNDVTTPATAADQTSYANGFLLANPTITNYQAANASVTLKSVTTDDILNSTKLEQTVYYYPTTITVDPNAPEGSTTTDTVTPKEPGTNASPIDPSDGTTPLDPTAPTYPKGVSQADLNSNVTETVHYVDDSGKTVAPDQTITLHYSRTAKLTLSTDGKTYVLDTTTPYSTWNLMTINKDDDGDGNLTNNETVTASSDDQTAYAAGATIDNPAVDSMRPTTPSITLKPVTTADIDSNATLAQSVTYTPSSTTVTLTPASDPTTFPSTVKPTDLTKTITETIQSKYADNTQAKDDKTFNVTYTRNATVTSSYDTDGKLVAGDPQFTPWTTNQTFASFTPTDIEGYTSTGVIDAITPSADMSDFTKTVYYVPDDALTKSVTVETVYDFGDLMDKQTSDQSIDYVHTPIVNADGSLGYTDWTLKAGEASTVDAVDPNDYMTILHDYFADQLGLGDNAADNIIYGAGGKIVTESASDLTSDVDQPRTEGLTYNFQAYYEVSVDGNLQETDPADQFDQKENTSKVFANSTVTVDSSMTKIVRTVTATTQNAHYVYVDASNNNKVVAEFEATPDYFGTRSSDWGAPTVKIGNTTYDVLKISANPAYISVDGSGSKLMGKESPSKSQVEMITGAAVGDTVYIELEQNHYTPTVNGNRTIKYVMADGSTAPDSTVQTDDWTADNNLAAGDAGQITYTTSVEDAADANVKALAHQAATGEKQDSIQYSDGTALESTGKTYTQVTGFSAFTDFPVVEGYYVPESEKGLVQATAVDSTSNTTGPVAGDEITITYYPINVTVNPDDPKNQGDSYVPNDDNSPKFPVGVSQTDLNQTATETITYIDNTTGQTLGTKDQTIDFTRTATVDVQSGAVTYGNWTTANDTFAAVDNPAFDNLTTKNAQVDAYTATAPMPLKLSVYYYPDTITVDPNQPADTTTVVTPKNPDTPIDPKNTDSPKYPLGVATTDLSQSATETITYIDTTTGQTLGTKEQTLDFTRTATVDVQSGAVTYGDWTTADGTFAAVANPAFDNLTAKDTQVEAYTVDGPTPLKLSVYYYPATITVDPNQPADTTTTVTPKNQGEPIDPDYKDSPKYPAGVDADHLNLSATETITYIDTTTGQTLGTKEQTLDFTRTATVDVQSGAVTYGDWTTADGTFAAVDNPAFDNLTTKNAQVDAYTATAPMPLKLSVYYYPATITVDPNQPADDTTTVTPKNQGEPIDPDYKDSPSTLLAWTLIT